MKKSTHAKTVRLFCLSCCHSGGDRKIGEIPERPICSKCGSGLLSKMTRQQDERRLAGLVAKRRGGEELTPEELEEVTYARRTADLILSYGKKAILALHTRGVGPETAFRILGKMHPNEQEFFIDLLKAKLKYIRTKPYWRHKDKQQF